MDKSRIGIIIPALNESATIAGIVEEAEKYGRTIVVDDGSSDNTAEVASKSGALIVLHKKNRGYDAALNSGFKKAVELNVKIIITLDADGQHNPHLILKYIHAIDSGADIVVGIRNHKQRFAEYLFAWYTRFRYGVQDPLCGMKAYRTELYKALGHFDSYGSVGTELTIFAAKNGYQFQQITFDVRNRKDDSRFGKILSANFRILRAIILSFLQVK